MLRESDRGIIVLFRLEIAIREVIYCGASGKLFGGKTGSILFAENSEFRVICLLKIFSMLA